MNFGTIRLRSVSAISSKSSTYHASTNDRILAPVVRMSMSTLALISTGDQTQGVEAGRPITPIAIRIRQIALNLVTTSLMSLALIGCQSVETGAPDMTYGWGAAPLLKPPEPQTVPVMKLSKAVGWKTGETPVPAEGFDVQAFAQGLDHPRWLFELPNGDILVAETDAPQASSGRGGVLAWFAKRVMRFTGSGYPSADRITLLRDTNKDGIADYRAPFIENLRSPFGMALVGSTFYVANTDAVLAFPYELGQTRISAPGELVAILPANAPNSHWTKNLLAHPDGESLFIAIGSNSNIGELGPDAEQGRAGIWRLDLATRELVPSAKGLRNPVGMAWHSPTETLWTVVNERDQLGNDLVPDYLAQVNEGDDFGWPAHYWGILHDPRVSRDWSPQSSAGRKDENLSKTASRGPSSDQGYSRNTSIRPRRIPNYALGAHTASLGLAFYSNPSIPRLKHHAIITQRGSWNRNPPSGYQVITVEVTELGKAKGVAKPLLKGFLSENGEAKGRPVGVIVDNKGAMLIADDVGDTVWHISRSN
jgi:glucose/arabinose dehydrogenase